MKKLYQSSTIYLKRSCMCFTRLH